MAQMADAFMKGFGFTDNMIRNHVEDARRTKEYDRINTEREADQKGLEMWVTEQLGTKPTPRSLDVFNTNVEDPVSAAETVVKFGDLKDKFDNGVNVTMLENEILDYMNSPTTFEKDLNNRLSGNGLTGKFSSIRPAGKDGLFFGVTVKDQEGNEKEVPLTVNKTRAGQPGSENDPVQVFKVEPLLRQASEAAETSMASLQYIASNGSGPMRMWAANLLKEKDNLKRAAMVEELKYQRDRGDKRLDTEAEHKFQLEKLGIENAAKNKDEYHFFEDKETGLPIGAGNKKTGQISPIDGMSAAGGAKLAFQTELGIVVKSDKDAASKMKDLGGVFMQKAVGSGSLADELAVAFKKVDGDMAEMAPAQKESIAGAARRIENDPNSTIEERSAAKNFREIGAYRGFWPGDSKVNPGMASSHNKSAMNPGNIRNGQGGQITGYKSPEEGVAAVDSLLKTYGSKHGLKTISGIMSRYSPPSENDTKAIISSISKMTGFAPDAELDMDNPATRTILAGAIFRQEHGTKAFTKQGASKNTQQNATGKPIDLNQFKRASATQSTTGEAQAATLPPSMGAVEQPGSKYGQRANGAGEKGEGFFGAIPTKDGKVMTEVSIGVNIDGKQTEIPSLVPTLTKDEVDYIAQGGDLKSRPEIVQKAVDHARQRIAEGRSPFAGQGEQSPLETRQPVQAPSLSSVQRVSQLAGQTAKGIADAGTVTGETMGMDTSSLPEATGNVLLKLRDEGEKLGTTEWWKNGVAALSEKALMALKAIGEKQRIDAAKIEAAAKARNVSLDQFLQEIASGFSSGYSN